MVRVTIDSITRAKLSNLDSYLELCDETGCVIGYFTPSEDRSVYAGVDSPEDDEELDRRSRDESQRPLEDILRDLESRKRDTPSFGRNRRTIV